MNGSFDKWVWVDDDPLGTRATPAAPAPAPPPANSGEPETSPLLPGLSLNLAALTEEESTEPVWTPEELLVSLSGIGIPLEFVAAVGSAGGSAAAVSAPSGLEHARDLVAQGMWQSALEAAAGVPGSEAAEVRGWACFQLGWYQEAAGHLEAANPRRDVQFLRGLCFERSNQGEKALQIFRGLVETNPADGRLWGAFGALLLRHGRPQEALAAFERGLAESNPPDSLLFGKSLACQQIGKSLEAEQTYHAFLKRQPECDDALVNLVALSGSGKRQDSLLRYSGLLLKRRADSPVALQTLAAIELEAGNWEAVASLCARIVAQEPMAFEAWFNLGVARQALHQYAEAVLAFHEAVRLRPASLEAQLALGSAQQEAGETDEAVQTYLAVLAGFPDDPLAPMQLAALAERRGQPAEAEHRLTAFGARHPEADEVHYRLGCLLLSRGAAAEAAGAFRTCLRQRPQWAKAQYNLALALWNQGELEAAGDLTARLTVEQPRWSAPIQLAAQLALQQGRLEDAAEWCRRLSALGERSVEALFNLGVLRQHEGEYEEAMRLFREALKERPQLREALERLGQIQWQLGHRDEAKVYFRRARITGPELIEKAN